MNPMLVPAANDYGGDTLMFTLSVVFLLLPLAALIAASLLDGLMRQRACRGHLAPAPLSLRALQLKDNFSGHAMAGLGRERSLRIGKGIDCADLRSNLTGVHHAA